MANENNNSINSENPLIQVQTTDWNKERLEQLKQLMPDLFTNDGELNINELKKVVDPKSVNETERYEFRWFGKSNAKREAFTPTDATLVYDEARSVNPNESENLIIEGENLAVLKLLSNSYREQVKCIYIDPPYNTGNDFVYSDKFNQDKKEYWEDAEITENGYKIDTNAETDGRFHSNWLNMMYSRLLIARQLLKEDGVIFISIDDNEVHHLRKLCDDVFGEENFVAELVWQKKTGSSDAKHIATVTESILVFAKQVLNLNLNQDEKAHDINRYKYRDEYYDERGPFYYDNLDRGTLGYIESLDYGVKAPSGKEVFPNGRNKQFNDGWRWKWGKEKLEWGLKNGFIEVQKSTSKECGFGVYYKIYLNVDNEGEKSKRSSPYKNIIQGILNTHASSEAKELFGNTGIFSNPKPTNLIKKLLLIGSQKNDIILDFFAGSGTTGQATAELNQEDDENRKYILVQLPEQTDEKSEAYKVGYKKISDITIERNKRVIEKIIKEKKEATPALFNTSTGSAQEKESELEQLKGLGFKVFKLQKSNFPRVEYAPDPEKTEEENIELLKKYIKDKEAQLVNAFNREELITEILLKNGFKLNYTLTKQEEFKKNEMLFVTDGDKETLICLDVIIADETVAHFKTNIDQKLIVLERALDTTKKWNLKHAMGDKFNAF
jgi:adenine-specific DNA-methyltransferase